MSQLDGINEREFERILGDSEGQGSLMSCNPRDCKELDTTERLNNKNTQEKSLIDCLVGGKVNLTRFIQEASYGGYKSQ